MRRPPFLEHGPELRGIPRGGYRCMYLHIRTQTKRAPASSYMDRAISYVPASRAEIFGGASWPASKEGGTSIYLLKSPGALDINRSVTTEVGDGKFERARTPPETLYASPCLAPFKVSARPKQNSGCWALLDSREGRGGDKSPEISCNSIYYLQHAFELHLSNQYPKTLAPEFWFNHHGQTLPMK